jgi:3-hydroxyacyl-[acyl-carrier-protein] dehydratase
MNDKVFLFTGMDKVRFRRRVVPGDQLTLRCFDVRHKLQLWKMNAEALVDGNVVAEAAISAAILDKGDM